MAVTVEINGEVNIPQNALLVKDTPFISGISNPVFMLFIPVGRFLEGKPKMNPATNDKMIKGLLFALTPQGRAAAYAWINDYTKDYVAKLEHKQESQSRQAVAQNELELGENHESIDAEITAHTKHTFSPEESI